MAGRTGQNSARIIDTSNLEVKLAYLESCREIMALRNRRISRWTILYKSAAALLITASLCAPRITAQQSDSAWETAFRQGAQAFRDGDIQAAEKSFTQVTQLEPHFAEGHFNLGLALQRLGHNAAAADEFRTALRLKPSLRGGDLFLGISLYASHQYKPAILALQRELAHDPKDAQAMLWLGRTELALNDPSAASNTLDKAAAIDPHNIDTLYYCGYAHMLASKEAYDKMYKVNPNSWRVHEVLGQAYSESDRYQQAIAEYQQAIKLAPREPQLHEWLGDEYLDTSNNTKAIEAYLGELSVSPKNYQAMYSLGMVQVETNDARDGVEALSKALTGDPTLTSAYYYLGWGEKKLGNNDAALKYLKMAIQTQPSPDLVQRSYYQLSRVYRLLNRPADSRAALAQFAMLKQKSDEQRNAKLSELMKKHGQPPAADNSSDPNQNSTNAPKQP